MLHRLWGHALDRPRWTCCVAAAVTLVAGFGLVRLKLRTDGRALVPGDAARVRTDRRVRDAFGVPDQIVVLVRTSHPDGIYNPHTLSLVDDLTADLQRLDGVTPYNVISLATEKGMRVRPGTLAFRRLLDPFPDSEQALARLRNEVRPIPIYRGTLVSQDESAAAIFVGIADSRMGNDETPNADPTQTDRSSEQASVAAIVRRIYAVIERHDVAPDTADVIGAPVAQMRLGLHILHDLGVPQALLAGEHATLATSSTSDGRRWLPHVGLVPVTLVLIFTVFLLRFRSVTAAVLPLCEVGACIAIVFGLMGWLGVPVYLTTTILPVILAVVGVADEVHIFHHFRQAHVAQAATGRRQALRETMDKMTAPVAKTSITTAVAFLSFAASPLQPVQSFGLMAAVGVMLCMLWSLTVVPAMITLAPRGAFRVGASSTPGGPGRGAERLVATVTRLRWLIILAAVFIAALATIGVSRTQVQDSWTDGFDPQSDFYHATRAFDAQFQGVHTLLVEFAVPSLHAETTLSADDVAHHTLRLPSAAIDAAQLPALRGAFVRVTPGREGNPEPPAQRPTSPAFTAWIEGARRDTGAIVLTLPRRAGSPRIAMRRWECDSVRVELLSRWLQRPETMQAIRRFERYLGDIDVVGGVLGPACYLGTARHMQSSGRHPPDALPASSSDLANLWHNLGQVIGRERLRQIVGEGFDSGIIAVHVRDSNFVNTRRLIDAINDYQRDHLAPQAIDVSLAGDIAVNQTMIASIVTSQLRSLLLSLVGVLLAVSLLHRSLAYGVLCVLPCGLTLLVVYGVMGYVGIPIGVATSMFGGMTLGIGVDYAVHLTEAYRRHMGLAAGAPLAAAVSGVGPPIITDALAIATGFGVMTLSAVPANARLGGVLVLSILTCLTATLVLLVALLAKGDRLSRSGGPLRGTMGRV